MRQETARIEDARRKKNIIIIGMAEGYDEREQVKDMLEALDCRGTIRAIIGRPTRLGAIRRERKRLLKVEFNDERAVEYIMERRWNLKFTEYFYSVYINRDLCKHDREKEKEERRQKKASRTSRAGENLNGGGGGGERPAPRNNNTNGGVNRNENEMIQEPRGAAAPIESGSQNQATNVPAENQITEQDIQQNLTTPGNVQRSEVRTEGGEGERERNNEERGGGVIANLASATYNGISRVVTTPFRSPFSVVSTPVRQRTADPVRNLENEVNDRTQEEIVEQTASNSGNRGGRVETGGD